MLNYQDVAKRYGVTEATILRWLKSSLYGFPKPSVHTGKTVLWHEDDLAAFEKGDHRETSRLNKQLESA
jgi:predicted DNA-binding transcriptional regulator AlpA